MSSCWCLCLLRVFFWSFSLTGIFWALTTHTYHAIHQLSIKHYASSSLLSKFAWPTEHEGRKKNCMNGNEILLSILLIIIIITWKQKRNQLVRVQKEPLENLFFLFPSLFHDLEYLEYACMCKLQFEKTATEKKKLVYVLKIIFFFLLERWRWWVAPSSIYKWNKLSGLRSKGV